MNYKILIILTIFIFDSLILAKSNPEDGPLLLPGPITIPDENITFDDCESFGSDDYATACINTRSVEDPTLYYGIEFLDTYPQYRRYYDFQVENTSSNTITCNTSYSVSHSYFRIDTEEDGCEVPGGTGEFQIKTENITKELYLKPGETKSFKSLRNTLYNNSRSSATLYQEALYCSASGISPNCRIGCPDKNILLGDQSCALGCETDEVKVLAGQYDDIPSVTKSDNNTCNRITIKYSCPTTGGTMNKQTIAQKFGARNSSNECVDGCLINNTGYIVGQEAEEPESEFTRYDEGFTFNARCSRLTKYKTCVAQLSTTSRDVIKYVGWLQKDKTTCSRHKNCEIGGKFIDHGSEGFTLSSCSGGVVKQKYYSCNEGVSTYLRETKYPCRPTGGGPYPFNPEE